MENTTGQHWRPCLSALDLRRSCCVPRSLIWSPKQPRQPPHDVFSSCQSRQPFSGIYDAHSRELDLVPGDLRRAKYGNSRQGDPAPSPFAAGKLSSKTSWGRAYCHFARPGPSGRCSSGVSQWPICRGPECLRRQCQAFMRPNIAQFSLLWELLTIGTTQKLHVESLCRLHHWMTPDARGCLVSPDVTLVVLDATAIPRRHAREPPSLAHGNWPRLFRCCAPPSLLIIFLFLSIQCQVELREIQE